MAHHPTTHHVQLDRPQTPPKVIASFDQASVKIISPKRIGATFLGARTALSARSLHLRTTRGHGCPRSFGCGFGGFAALGPIADLKSAACSPVRKRWSQSAAWGMQFCDAADYKSITNPRYAHRQLMDAPNAQLTRHCGLASAAAFS
jgi:hypothetical protein